VDIPQPIRLPFTGAALVEHELAEVAAATQLVARGVARRIVLTGFFEVEAVAGMALVIAQAAGVRFALERHAEGSVAVVIGPREA
jgi:hypothetical protein